MPMSPCTTPVSPGAVPLAVLHLSPVPRIDAGTLLPSPPVACPSCGGTMEVERVDWCGVWHVHPGCPGSVLTPSAALLAQHVEMGGAEAVVSRGYVAAVVA